MKWNSKISHLLTGLVAVTLVLNVVVLLVTEWGVMLSDEAAHKAYAAKDVTADILPPPMYLIEMRLHLSQVLDGTASVDELAREVDRLESEYKARVAYWKAHPPYGLETHLLGDQHEAGLRFIEAAREVVNVARQGDQAALVAAIRKANNVYELHRQGVDVTVAEAVGFADASIIGAERLVARIKWGTLALTIVSALLVLAVARYVMRRVLVPVHEAVEVAGRIAAGDFTQPVSQHHTGEMGELMASMAHMQHALTQLVAQVRHATDSIQTASAEIAAGNLDLSQRTERASASLQETAASMEQLSNAVRHNAESAHQASQMVESASDIARNGGAVVHEVVSTMNNIRGSSHKINDIIGVIDSIAFQTNILALNAAVEAARAAEHGRGFAVVAGEVRTLAQRSAQAAREIKQLIGHSVSTVESGSQLVDNAGGTMEKVVASVQQVSSIVTQISAGASEQREGINQINTAVSQLDQVTQQNAALVEQSAAAAESLKEQALRLAELVSRFRINPGWQTGV